MAFNVRLMPVKVIDSEWDFIFDSPFVGTDDTVARGIRYAADNGAKVINMSLGRDGAPAPAVQSAIAYAVSHGVVRRGGRRQRVRRRQRQRALRRVRAADRRHGGRWARPDAIGCAPATRWPRSYIELVAPGGDFTRGGATGGILQQTLDLDLVETFTGPVARYRAPRFDVFAYYYFEGTSMATPHVVGPRGAAGRARASPARRPSKRS